MATGLEYSKDLASAVQSWMAAAQSLAVFVGVIVGGLWSYKLFIQKRLAYPRLKLTHEVIWRPLAKGHSHFRLSVTVENCGEILFVPQSLAIQIIQLEPVHPAIAELLEKTGKLCLDESKREAEWPLVGDCSHHTTNDEIEPGESHEYHFDFVIPAEVTHVLAYSYFKNTQKKTMGSLRRKPREIGWSRTTEHSRAEGVCNAA